MLTRRERLLLGEAHYRYLTKINAFNGNIGWVVDENSYTSKTRSGIITTRRVSPRKYEHSIWEK